ncbi:polysaccharide biosynthesis tyrosine autokinase [Fulvivirga sp. RKSG066]|uniref:GumC family protein n=1 Tax=Fulvivirga aurantia TaxID=2529383 RepID=UPI0012BBF7B2|nr:tyrosine-protein kinase [Fulvivirga aurantia]MTI20054.1 polysaccharide biosynthesis tyrosine autokinase [Fulvivirga aurantia]
MNTPENNIGASTQGANDSLDFEKAGAVLKKSIIWIILIFALTISAAYLFIRWTKPLFESVSELKLDVKSDATELGLAGLTENKNLNIISGEIELLKSKLFTSKVIETIDLSVSYYTAGQVLNDEKYNISPIEIDYELKDQSLYDTRIYVEIQDATNFKISFNGEEGYLPDTYKFGELISTNRINLIINTTKFYDPQGDKKYFFTINSNDALVKYFENNLTVEPLNLNANTIKIALKDHNKYKAHDLVNAIDTIYLNYSQEEKNRENRQKIAWLNEELNEIETELEGYENYFENFTIRNRTSDLDEDLKRTIEVINALDSQRYELNTKIVSANELISNIDQGEVNREVLDINPLQYPQFVVNSLTELATLIEERDQLKLSYNEATFALTKKDNEIESLQQRLKSQLISLRDRYQEQIKDLIIRKRKLEQNFVEIPEKSTEYKKNQRFFDLYEEFYLGLMQSKAQYQIAQAGTTTEFKILSSATLPTNPIYPNNLIVYGIGVVFGFVLSFLFVSIRYLLHNKVTSVGELEKITSAPILGTIPNTADKMEVTKLVINQNPKSAVSEALRSLRTNIEFMISGSKKRVISVTSTIGGEGKTFVSVNLGGIIALSKKKVLLLDLDMRKPRVHKSFSHSNSEKGMSTVLINKHNIEDCIVPTEIEGFDYVPAGPTPPNPSELILNGEFEILLEKLKASYDLIILDTPPVGLVTDGVLAMKRADLAIYIVRANYTKKLFLRTLNRLINVNQFKNLAVVLNASSTSGSNSYGYGYYEEKKNDSVIKRFVK